MWSAIKPLLDAQNVTLVVVSKTQSPKRIMALYAQGQRIFGENRVQELIEKQAQLPEDIAWHMIGHLQTNKVKTIAPFVQMIHSVDSLKLLQEIDKQAFKYNRKIDCLLQFHIAQEETKFGLSMAEAEALLSPAAIAALQNVRLCGVMGMASFSEDKALVRSEFRALRGIFQHLKSTYFLHQHHFKEISMGMSGDWPIAVEEGSTMLRIGSAIFA